MPNDTNETSLPATSAGSEKLNSWLGTSTITIIASLSTFILGFVGHWYTFRVEDRKLDLEILKLATDVLKTKPSESGGEDMRRWSLKVLETYSRVTFIGDSPVTKQVNLAAIQDFVGNRIDVDIFVCDTKDQVASQLAAKYGAALMSKFGRIRVKKWNGSDELGLDKLRGKTTIIYDNNEAEKDAASDMELLSAQIPGIPKTQKLVNAGKPTPWYLSAIICE